MVIGENAFDRTARLRDARGLLKVSVSHQTDAVGQKWLQNH